MKCDYCQHESFLGALNDFHGKKVCARCMQSYTKLRSGELAPSNRRKQESNLFSFGMVLLILGIIGIGLSLTMKTSISTGIEGNFKEVSNIGLLNDKQNYIIVSTALSVVGALMVVVAYLPSSILRPIGLPVGVPKSNTENRPQNIQSLEHSETKECPMCAETVKSRAIKCRFCGHAFG